MADAKKPGRSLRVFRYRLQKLDNDGNIISDERFSLLSGITDRTGVHRGSVLRHLRGISKRKTKLDNMGWRVLKEIAPRLETRVLPSRVQTQASTAPKSGGAPLNQETSGGLA